MCICFIGRSKNCPLSYLDVSEFTFTDGEGTLKFFCPKENCQRTYKNKHHLIRHLRFECGKEPQFQCSVCYKRMRYRTSLKNHMIFVHEMRLPETRTLIG